jgi:hypothetical protein
MKVEPSNFFGVASDLVQANYSPYLKMYCADCMSRSNGRELETKLSDERLRQFYMVPDLAHAFCVLSDTADVQGRAGRPDWLLY